MGCRFQADRRMEMAGMMQDVSTQGGKILFTTPIGS